MPTVIHRNVRAANEGEFPQVVCRMKSGWLVMGDKQIRKGYCLLLPDPVVPHLNSLQGPARDQFLRDMALAGDALLHITGAARINYAILGNLEPALHAHLIPRYADEPDEVRSLPPFQLDWNAAPAFDPEREMEIMHLLREQLEDHDG